MSEHTLDITKFRARYPKPFSDAEVYPDVVIEAQWDLATVMISPYDNWLVRGKKLQIALEYMTCHLLALNASPEASEESGGASGMVASASEGSVSVSFATPTVGDFNEYWLSQTKWGQMLLVLMESLVSGGFTLGGKPETSAMRDVGGVF